MALKIKCLKCDKELDEKGALIISPPIVDLHPHRVDGDLVAKIHICSDCFLELESWIHKYKVT
jgi:hypothetical protein